MRPHRRQPTGLHRPWDSLGKNTGVGCHFLLQCMKVKSESEVAQSCPTLSDLMDCSLPGSSVHGIFQARGLEWGAIAFSGNSSIAPTSLELLILQYFSPFLSLFSNTTCTCTSNFRSFEEVLGFRLEYNWEIAKGEFILTCNFYNFCKESIFVYYLFY